MRTAKPTTPKPSSPPEPRRLVWEKWVNPITGAGKEDAIAEASPHSLEDEYIRKEREEYDSDLMTGVYRPKLGQVIVGPMGIIPMKEHGDPAVVYDFWLAHTNFWLTPSVVATALSVPGIEAWDTFSPYRARVAFGKAFDRAKVMDGIHKALGVTFPKPPKVELQKLAAWLSKKYQAWAIVEKADGDGTTVFGDEADVRKKVAEAEAQGRKIFITSWEYRP